jgi:hypothetical protein
MPPKKLTALANEKVPFSQAATWAGLGTGARDRGMKATCPSCHEDQALRVYPDHAWCFSERKWFTTVVLLSVSWDMDFAEAASEALRRVGYVASDYAGRFAEVQRVTDPARDDLAEALRTFCRGICPDWVTRQYDPGVAALLSRCLGLLPLVTDEGQCALWLAKCKQAMRKALSPA